MVDRLQVEQLLQQLYAARVGGRLDELCALFADDAHFRIAGTSDGKPIAVAARGIREIRSWLAMMLQSFKLNRREGLCSLIDGVRIAEHWCALIHSLNHGAGGTTGTID